MIWSATRVSSAVDEPVLGKVGVLERGDEVLVSNGYFSSGPPVSPGDRPTEAPVLIVAGEMDNMTTPEEGRKVAAEFPNSEFYLARNGGHVDALYHRHRDGDTASEVRRFLRRNVDPG